MAPGQFIIILLYEDVTHWENKHFLLNAIFSKILGRISDRSGIPDWMILCTNCLIWFRHHRPTQLVLVLTSTTERTPNRWFRPDQVLNLAKCVAKILAMPYCGTKNRNMYDQYVTDGSDRVTSTFYTFENVLKVPLYLWKKVFFKGISKVFFGYFYMCFSFDKMVSGIVL